MLILLVVVLTLIPTALILWPFVAGPSRDEFEYDEGEPQADLMRRWDVAVAGLASAELDHALGNMSEADYRVVQRQLMTEAAAIMREMESGRAEEERMFAELGAELQAGAR